MDQGVLDRIKEAVGAHREDMVRFLSDIVAVPAIAPSSGGVGEWDKVELIEQRARSMGLSDIERHDAPDPTVPAGARPNLVVWLRASNDDPGGGRDRPRLLVVCHVDVVPPGNLDDWRSDPFQAVVRDGKVFGRGTVDNGQSIAAALFALKALSDLAVTPPQDVGVVLVSDEEVENDKGIAHLVREGFFRPDDLILVPDHGEPDGRLVDVSEKAIAWVKVTTKGVQCHPSLPRNGINALRAGMRFGTMVDEALHAAFPSQDPLFDHPLSSFEPTKKEPNVPNVNMVPGEDVFYIDCRVLPQYRLSDVLAGMRAVADGVETDTGTKITLDPVLMEEAAEPTPVDAPIVQRLLRAIDRVLGNDPRAGGIGGGTCAAVLRRAGHHAAVWETVPNVAHAPNEHAVIDDMVNDCRVMATLFVDGG
jgi:succinyl-diaminopimelate desuccinylase